MTVNVSDLLRDAARRHAHRTALVEHRDGRRALTWAELDRAADAVARGLSGRGLVAGQRVAVVMANRIDLAAAYFGILRGGMVAVPLNPRSSAREVARMLADSGARVVLCDERGAPPVREALAEQRSRDVGVVVAGVRPRRHETSFADFLRDAPTLDPTAPPDAELRAVILYTLGADGQPRGAVLTHRALLANIDQAAAVEPPLLTSRDIALGLLPMFHIYGLNAVLGQSARQGATLVMVDGFDPETLLDTIRDEGVTSLALAPPVIAAWAGRDGVRERLAGVHRVLCGAANLDPDLAAAFTESTGHPVEQGYGLTETAPVIAVTLASPRAEGEGPKPGSVGRPLPGIELRLVEASGVDAAPGDPAEIWVRGANLFSGYWPDGADGPRPDGWYPTGDVGYLDDDGDLVLIDRLGELVSVSGFSVYPSEVEEVVAAMPQVVEAAVVGLPDEQTGQAVAAFVVPAPGVEVAGLADVVREHCTGRLARFKVPSRVIVVEDLPQSASGRVAKGRLRALARSEALGLDHA